MLIWQLLESASRQIFGPFGGVSRLGNLGEKAHPYFGWHCLLSSCFELSKKGQSGWAGEGDQLVTCLPYNPEYMIWSREMKQ